MLLSFGQHALRRSVCSTHTCVRVTARVMTIPPSLAQRRMCLRSGGSIRAMTIPPSLAQRRFDRHEARKPTMPTMPCVWDPNKIASLEDHRAYSEMLIRHIMCEDRIPRRQALLKFKDIQKLHSDGMHIAVIPGPWQIVGAASLAAGFASIPSSVIIAAAPWAEDYIKSFDYFITSSADVNEAVSWVEMLLKSFETSATSSEASVKEVSLLTEFKNANWVPGIMYVFCRCVQCM